MNISIITRNGGYAIDFPNGKFPWMVKIGEKGQLVIPKETRDMFDLQPGSAILVLGYAKRGLAILPRKAWNSYITRIFVDMEQVRYNGQNRTVCGV